MEKEIMELGHEPKPGYVKIFYAVIASYRGYDTLGETTVIFTAGVCVILLLRRWKKD